MTEEQNSPEKRPDNVNFPPRKVVCVGAVVLRGEKVLFIRQAAGQSLAGKWSIPWGFVEADEAPEDAALRETLEESGVSASIEGFLGFQNLNQTGWIGMIFLCRHESGEPRADGVETDDARYLGLEELDALGNAALTWCAWLAKKALSGNYTLIKETPNIPKEKNRGFL